MQLIALLIAGATIGFFAALPIGPVNLLCIRRTLALGTINGFLGGLGAAVADGIFAAIVAFGLTAIKSLLEGYQPILELVGGALLVFFGYREFVARPHMRDDDGSLKKAGRASLPGAIATTFALAITNPATAFGFAISFSAVSGLLDTTTFFSPLFLVIGVLSGSTLWWLTLATIIGRIHHAISSETMARINKVCGVIVMVFGLALLGHVTLRLF
jgi:threonine/homoserine/homoserine lactone efflux protein